MSDIRQVGIPWSIFHHEMGGIFQRFFEQLGLRVVLSPQTTRSIFQLGKRSPI